MATASDRKVAEGRGSVYAGGQVFVEGDTVPDDVEVGAHIFEPAAPVEGGEPRVDVAAADEKASASAAKSAQAKS